MNDYIRNRNCPCVRCRTHDLMGAAVLITLGVLFLLSNNYVFRFEQGLPALLLVIGVVLLISRTGSTEGHVNPGWRVGVPPPPAQPAQSWTTGIAAPPATQPQWTPEQDNTTTNDPNNPQVKS